jgi:small conductance mechanosensitive channel
MGYSRVNFSLSIAPSNDLDMVISLINQVGDELAADKTWKSKIIEAPQFDSIGTFSASSVDITIVGKVQPSDQWRVTAEMRRRLLEEFDKAGIKLA